MDTGSLPVCTFDCVGCTVRISLFMSRNGAAGYCYTGEPVNMFNPRLYRGGDTCSRLDDNSLDTRRPRHGQIGRLLRVARAPAVP